MITQGIVWNSDKVYQPIFTQCSTSIPPENIRKPSVLRFSDVFRGDRSGKLGENGLRPRSKRYQ